MPAFTINVDFKSFTSIPCFPQPKDGFAPWALLGSPFMKAGHMDRKELLRLLLHQAQFNGFDFSRWFQSSIRPVWPGTEQAISTLVSEGRFYALLFCHDFARCFWREGSQISFSVPGTTYRRVNSRGEVLEVSRKPFTRRSNRPDVWKYHLRQMAGYEDPIEYLCRFLPEADQVRVRAGARAAQA